MSTAGSWLVDRLSEVAASVEKLHLHDSSKVCARRGDANSASLAFELEKDGLHNERSHLPMKVLTRADRCCLPVLIGALVACCCGLPTSAGPA